jgi:hypothetical protein
MSSSELVPIANQTKELAIQPDTRTPQFLNIIAEELRGIKATCEIENIPLDVAIVNYAGVDRGRLIDSYVDNLSPNVDKVKYSKKISYAGAALGLLTSILMVVNLSPNKKAEIVSCPHWIRNEVCAKEQAEMDLKAGKEFNSILALLAGIGGSLSGSFVGSKVDGAINKRKDVRYLKQIEDSKKLGWKLAESHLAAQAENNYVIHRMAELRREYVKES